MTGQTNTGGGSIGAQRKGTIGVKYPSGAICTVTNGSQTYTALDTSGAAAFVVDPGTWTVKAVQGSNTKSQSVTVTAGGWVEVALSFRTYLYNNGDECTALTGGLTIPDHPNATVTENSNNIYFNGWVGNDNHSAVIYTTNKVNLADYKTLYIKYSCSRSAEKLHFGVKSSVPGVTSAYAGELSPRIELASTSETKEVSLDISSCNGSYYVALALWGATGYLYEIYMKK